MIKALKISIEIFGENSFDAGRSHYNISGIYFSLNNNRDAYEHMNKTVNIWQNILSSNHSNLIDARRYLEVIKHKL